MLNSGTAGGCEGAGAGLVLKIARCSRLMQIVCACVCGCLTRREPGVEWSGVSLGESEVDCIGVGHGSCSVMHALWSTRTASVSVRVCVCVRLSGVATNLGRGKYGESGMGPALVPGKEQGASARAGNGREEQASEREGTLQGGGGGGMYCAMLLVMLRSVSNPHDPPVRHSADY